MAVIIGILLGAGNPVLDKEIIERIALPCKLIFKALVTLATPLIFLSILHTLITAEMPSNSGRKLSILIVTNIVVAVTIGLLIANVLHPGAGGHLSPSVATAKVAVKPLDPWNLLSLVSRSSSDGN